MADGQDHLTEAQRRARILERYIVIERPTAEDDERFAGELGLSRDALYRLAKSWRLHGDETLLRGSRTKASVADRKAALAAAADPDLTGVNPTRRPLIRRRLEALRGYLRLDAPTAEDERRAATSLDMSIDAFQRLHRSWVLTRDPAALPGGSTPARTPKRRAPALSPELELLMDAVFTELGPDASTAQVHREIAARCQSAGMRVPDKSTVYFRFVDARAKMGGAHAATSFAIDHSAIELPVRTSTGDQLPVLSAVVALPRGRIIAHALALDPPDPRSTARLLIHALGQSTTGDYAAPLHMGAPKGRDWDQLLRMLDEGGVEVALGPTRSLRPGHFLTRLFGTRVGRLKLRPRLATRPTEAPIRPMGRGSEPLSLQEARDVVDEVVADINAGRSEPDAAWVAASRREALVRSLDDIGS